MSTFESGRDIVTVTKYTLSILTTQKPFTDENGDMQLNLHESVKRPSVIQTALAGRLVQGEHVPGLAPLQSFLYCPTPHLKQSVFAQKFENDPFPE